MGKRAVGASHAAPTFASSEERGRNLVDYFSQVTHAPTFVLLGRRSSGRGRCAETVGTSFYCGAVHETDMLACLPGPRDLLPPPPFCSIACVSWSSLSPRCLSSHDLLCCELG